MGKLIVVSGSDAAYFPLLKDWLTCIKSFSELTHCGFISDVNLVTLK